MIVSRIKMVSVIILITIFIAGCWNPFNPQEEEPDETIVTYLEPTSPDNVLKNLISSYNSGDIDMYIECLSQDKDHPFVFHLMEQDWQDLNNDGVKERFWGIELEEKFTKNMFEQAQRIHIDDFRGSVQYPDSHNEDQIVLKREFDLEVWLDNNFGMKAQGEALFTMRENDEGEWKIVKWVDKSNIY